MRLSLFQKTLLIELKSLESIMGAVVIVQSSDDIVLLNAWWLHDCMWPISPMWVVQSWWVKVASRFANWRSFLTIRDGANRPNFGGTGMDCLGHFSGQFSGLPIFLCSCCSDKETESIISLPPPSTLPDLRTPTYRSPLSRLPFPSRSSHQLLRSFALPAYPPYPLSQISRQQLPLASDSPFMVFRSCRKSRAVGAVLVFVLRILHPLIFHLVDFWRRRSLFIG